MILDDIRRAVARARADRASKRGLGFPEPRLVILVGNRGAYIAARQRVGPWPALTEEDLGTFEGCPVEFGGCIGVDAVWRS